MDINTDLLIMLVILLIVMGFVFSILSGMGINFGDIIVGTRATRRVTVDEEPRDQFDRFITNHRKVARDSKPSELKFLYTSGDLDVPPKKIGLVSGLEPHQEGYLIFVRHHRWQWGKPHIIPRELCGDANRRVLFIHARAFTHNGLLRLPIVRGPPHDTMTPDELLTRCRNLFRTFFREQTLTDAEEDSAWAQATGMMPRAETRIGMAEVEVPHLADRQYLSEDKYLKGGS
jgi:hypothetical protein